MLTPAIAGWLLTFLCHERAWAVQLQPAAMHVEGGAKTGSIIEDASDASLLSSVAWHLVLAEVQEAQWASHDGSEEDRHANQVAQELSPSLIALAKQASESASSVAMSMSKQFSRPVLVVEDLLTMDPFDKHQLLFKIGDQTKVVAQLPNAEVAMFRVQQVRELVNFVEYVRVLDLDRVRLEAEMSPSDCPDCGLADLVNRAVAKFAAKLRSEFSRAQEAVGVCSKHCYGENHLQVEWHGTAPGTGKCKWEHCAGCEECLTDSHVAEVLGMLAAEQVDETTGHIAELLSRAGQEVIAETAHKLTSVERYLEMAPEARVDLSGTCRSFCESMPATWKHKCGRSQLSRYCGTCSLCEAGECSPNCYTEQHAALPWQHSSSGQGRCSWVHCRACQECQVEQFEA